MIKAENLKKIYPGKIPTPALKGVTFEVQRGEFWMLTGRSGAGKSTLLHQLGLLDRPTEGALYLNDVDVTKLDELQRTEFRLRNLGYVFQEYALIIELTALENVYLPDMAAGTLPEHYRKHAAELLTLVGLGDRVDHYPNELSGGEQQRVAIARSLINNPKILFADEPTANLDSQSAKTVLELFAKLNKELGQTIILVSHEPEEVRTYVDKIIWMNDGLIEKIESRM
ncbi:MAG TPA: ABC transporter ATP-binding protein [Candidatus Paceibacterota bacterium]|nr:ABC transporter ATP-binding protein [Candidatus Paceibacterota bacterium]